MIKPSTETDPPQIVLLQSIHLSICPSINLSHHVKPRPVLKPRPPSSSVMYSICSPPADSDGWRWVGPPRQANKSVIALSQSAATAVTRPPASPPFPFPSHISPSGRCSSDRPGGWGRRSVRGGEHRANDEVRRPVDGRFMPRGTDLF